LPFNFVLLFFVDEVIGDAGRKTFYPLSDLGS